MAHVRSELEVIALRGKSAAEDSSPTGRVDPSNAESSKNVSTSFKVIPWAISVDSLFTIVILESTNMELEQTLATGRGEDGCCCIV